MKLFFYLLLLLPLSILAQPKIDYKIYYSHQLEKQGLKVAVQTKLNKAADSTFFHYYNSIWGEANLLDCVTNLQSENPGYHFKIVPDSNRIVVYHPNTKDVRFSYHIKQNFSDTDLQKFSNPRVKDHYFHLLGQSLFAVPEAFFIANAEDSEMNMSVEWIGFPKEFVIHNTFATNQKKQQMKVKIETHLFHSLFVGGDYRIHTIPYQNKNIHFAIRGAWLTYDDTTLLTHLKRAVFSQREFWNDNNFPYYTVIMTPTATIKDTSYKGYSMKGTSVHQGFMLESSNSAHNSWGEVVYMFNHELMHEWIGTKIKTRHAELNNWFSEGFTDYYAYKNRLRSGDITMEQWVRIFNKAVIEAHYKNPQKNQPNYSIKDHFWQDQNYQKLPYRKGALFAFWLDNQILKRSNYTQSLDDVMREVLLKVKTQNRKFSDEWFLELVQPYLKEDISYFFQKHIISNVDFNFTTDAIIKGLKVEQVDKIPVLHLIEDKDQVKRIFLNQK